MTVWTIGHSTHSFEEFVRLLAMHDISLLADIRTVPKSRRHPHFDAEALAQRLPGRGVAYVELPRLGGWRRAVPDSPNGAWRNLSFRGYADHAMSEDFGEGLTELRELAAVQPTAMMCAEAVWWRCHRRLVADRLVIAGDTVCHIAADGRTSLHRLTEFAVVSTDGPLTYPASAARLLP
jgi:uncharacterized protein (DUF488 family)